MVIAVIGVRIKSSESWLDPQASGLLGWKLGKRLWSRVAGQKGVFITLTYRRDEYASSLDLYRCQAERQDVTLFMRRLGRRLGRSLKGKWICKLEFQTGGWVHWHIILLDVERVEHAMLTEAWGYGHTWIEKLTKKRVFYTCKYVAKGGDHNLPSWIFGEKPRSVKIVRVSSGFWGEASRKSLPSGIDYGTVVNGYTPIGVKLKRRGVEVKCDRGRFSFRCDPGEFFLLLSRQTSCVGESNRWLLYHVPLCVIQDVVADCGWRIWGEAAGRLRGAPRPERSTAADGPPPRSGGLHLKGTGNPDDEVELSVPWWYQEQLREEAIAEDSPCKAA